MPPAEFLLILNRNENIVPGVARLDRAQAAAYFMLGETTGTSAGGKDEEGKFLRVPGTNPFFPRNMADMGNRMLELLDSHELKVYVLNTGRVGGKDDATSKKVTIPYSSAIVQAIVEDTIEWETDDDFGYEVATVAARRRRHRDPAAEAALRAPGPAGRVRRHRHPAQEGAQGVPRVLRWPGRGDRQVHRLTSQQAHRGGRGTTASAPSGIKTDLGITRAWVLRPGSRPVSPAPQRVVSWELRCIDARCCSGSCFCRDWPGRPRRTEQFTLKLADRGDFPGSGEIRFLAKIKGAQAVNALFIAAARADNELPGRPSWSARWQRERVPDGSARSCIPSTGSTNDGSALRSPDRRSRRHVGVMCDGNRRWARSAGLMDVSSGHRKGADKIFELLGWCRDAGVEVVTLWLLSTDNLVARPESEIEPLLAIIEDTVRELVAQNWRVKPVGALDLLPAETASVLKDAGEATANYPGPAGQRRRRLRRPPRDRRRGPLAAAGARRPRAPRSRNSPRSSTSSTSPSTSTRPASPIPTW